TDNRVCVASRRPIQPEESNLILLGSRTATLVYVSLRKNLIFVGLILWHTRCVRTGLPNEQSDTLAGRDFPCRCCRGRRCAAAEEGSEDRLFNLGGRRHRFAQ